MNSKLNLPVGVALFAALAVGLMFLLSGGLLQAQDGDAIMYPENGTGPVATFTAVDPEGESIVWSLAGADMGDFSIENGVLRFMSSPDFEAPTGTDVNTYSVTIEASDGGQNTTAMEDVTIEVTNVDEDGTVTLSTLQPQVNVAITATLDDPDNATANTVTWQWNRGNSEIAGATTASYTPTAGDVGSVLRATAMYDDGEDEDKTAQEDSAHAVREAPESNIPPSFPDQDLNTGGVQTQQTREVAENTPAGTNLGAPVAASDPDVLTYSLDTGNAAAAFDITRATGQLMTKAALNHETEDSYIVTVTATDPFGATVMSEVTITVTDVNEAPSVEGVASIDHAENAIVLDADASPDAAEAAVYTATDADDADDAAELRWSLSGADAGKFNITDSGAMRTLSFKEAPDYESPGDSGGNNVYEVTVKVTDSKSNSDEQDVTVKVTNMEEDGTIELSTLQPRVGFPVTATLADPDNVTAGSVSWQWYRGTNIQTTNLPDECAEITSNDCAIKDAASDTYTPVADDIGDTLNAVATYTDGSPNEDDAKDVVAHAAENVVLADTRNNAPVFPEDTESGQTDQERMIAENTETDIDIGDPVTATDEDMNLTYSLGGADAASFDIVRSSGQLKTKAELDKETKDTFTVTVTAEDSLNASSTISVIIKVTNVDEMPDLEGDAPEEYAENGTGAVATFTAVDPEGESIVWSLAASDDMGDFSIENGVLRFMSSPDFEDPADTDMANTYLVTIEASDGGQDTTATEEVTIEVTNVDEDGTVTLSTLQPQVAKPIMATLDDPDNETANTVTWQWYRGRSLISSATAGAGTIMSSYTPTPGDVGSVLRATAMYDDDEGEDKTAQEVSYRSVRRAPDTNTDPVFPDQDLIDTGVQTEQTREVAENTRAGTNLGAPVAASDPGDVLTYSLDSGDDADAFDITRATGQLMTKAPLNHEMKDTYTVTVTATDPFGAMVMSEVAITVTDVNEAPSVEGVASIDHAENETVLDVDASNNAANPADYTVTDADVDDLPADLKWSLSGADAGKFNITDSGGMRTLSFKEAPDYESPGDSGGNNVYEVTVKVTDSKSNSDEQDVTIKVTNVEELGTIELSTLQPRVGFPVTATLADPDNVTAGSVSWQWYRGTNIQTTNLPDECAEITSNDCAIKDAASDTYTPVADDIGDTLNAVATYYDGSPNEDDAKDVVVHPAANPVLADTRNKAPVFPEDTESGQTDQERMIAENTPSDTIIGDAVVATDFIIAAIDGGMTEEKLTYSLGGADAASFDIVRNSGQLMTKAELDKETKDTYTVTVTATDPSGEIATAMVTIKVTNVDEAPMIMVGGLAISGIARVDYAENGTEAVATYTASGPDADMAAWSLDGDDANAFSLSNNRELMFMQPPDYENPMDADMDNVYMVTIMADDGTYMDTHDVMVEVTNVNERGTVSLSTMRPVVDTEVTATLDDLDGMETDEVWQWARSMDGTTTFMDIAEATMYTYSPVAMDEGYYLRAMVMYTDGHGSGKEAMMLTANTVSLGVTGMSIVGYPENGTNPVDTYMVAGFDPVATWSVEGDDAGAFSISSGGMLMFRQSPDYENPMDIGMDNMYMVTVKASDGTRMDTHDVMVEVTNVDEDGVVTLSGMNPVAGTMVTAMLEDPDGTVSGEMWQWAKSMDMDGTFMDIGGATTTYTPTFDDVDYYLRATVMYTDGLGTGKEAVGLSANKVLARGVSVTGPSSVDHEENDVGSVATYVASGLDADTATWSLEGVDEGDFDISNDGVLTFKESPNFENAVDMDTDNTYMVTVKANVGTYMDTQDVMVMVTNVDEMGEVTLWAGTDALTMAPQVGDTITGAVMDPDGGVTGETWQWSRTTDTADMNSWMDIQDATDAAYMVTAGDAGYYLRVMATYTDAAGTDMEHSMPTMMVGAEAGDTLLDRYDKNNDGQIDRPEVLDAIRDFVFNQTIEREDVVAVIRLSVFGR